MVVISAFILLFCKWILVGAFNKVSNEKALCIFVLLLHVFHLWSESTRVTVNQGPGKRGADPPRRFGQVMMMSVNLMLAVSRFFTWFWECVQIGGK